MNNGFEIFSVMRHVAARALGSSHRPHRLVAQQEIERGKLKKYRSILCEIEVCGPALYTTPYHAWR